VVQLAELCVNAPEELRFDILNCVSANRWNFVDIGHARHAVGYEPQDHVDDSFPA
jgi:hypothetical protein